MGSVREITQTMSVVPMHQVFDYIPFHEGSKKSSALAEEVYEHILREIVFPGEDPATHIHYAGKITESLVVKELRVSNGPVREAFYRLRQEGWLYTDRNRGSYLVDFSDPDIAMDIYRFRVNFETGSFFCLAAQIKDEQLAVLERIIEKMEQAVQNSEINVFRREDINFHLAVIEMAGGSQFVRVYRPKLMQWYAMAYQVLIRSIGSKQSGTLLEAPGLPTHRELFESLAQRNSQHAAELISRHFSYIFKLLDNYHDGR